MIIKFTTIVSMILSFAGCSYMEGHDPISVKNEMKTNPLSSEFLIEEGVIHLTIQNRNSFPVHLFLNDNVSDYNQLVPYFSYIRIKNEFDEVITETLAEPDGWHSPNLSSSEILPIPVSLNAIEAGQNIERKWRLASMVASKSFTKTEYFSEEKYYNVKIKINIFLDKELNKKQVIESDWIKVLGKRFFEINPKKVQIVIPGN